ncbi:Alpha/Beta hydrolase protein [Dipodascopsis uninucleata]
MLSYLLFTVVAVIPFLSLVINIHQDNSTLQEAKAAQYHEETLRNHVTLVLKHEIYIPLDDIVNLNTENEYKYLITTEPDDPSITFEINTKEIELVNTLEDGGDNINEDETENYSIVRVPDATDKDTVLTFAKMSSNAYARDHETNRWINPGDNWNRTMGIGWDSDGMRGHVFVDEEDSIVVLALKGTSIRFGSDTDTVRRDKLNDNMLFSCCCGRAGFSWSGVCDCYEKVYTCKHSCLESELCNEEIYYSIAVRTYEMIAAIYPTSHIWLTGHSLAGALSSLVSQTKGSPAIVFQAPGEQLAAKRLHLPSSRSGDTMVWHIGNTADPIFMGTCNGPMSICAIGGYAMETECHSGYECVYDNVREGTTMSIEYHKLSYVMELIEKSDEIPVCHRRQNCVDCYMWNYT